MSCDIELEVGAGSGDDEYTVQVIRAPSGAEPSATTRLDVDGLLGERDTLESTVLASAVTGRRIASPGEQKLQQVGRQLFEALFSGPVYGAYRASLGAAQQQGQRLRVVLRLTVPRLAALPWEAMFDPESGTYICRKEPLVRHVPAPYTSEPLEVTPPLRVLGLVASPRGLPVLDVTAEQAQLSQALAGPIAEGLIELVWLPQASWDSVQEKLLSEQWHVLHFIGHGDYDPSTDQGLIALVGRDQRANLVGSEQLADLLNEARPTPRLVVLNSCSSGEQGTQDLFSGTAAALVRSGINAVAAMQFTLSDSAAIAFAKGFYTAIAHGHSVDDATRSGRIAILGAPGTLEWVTPVLYVRGNTTELFQLSRRSRAPVQTTASAPPETPPPREQSPGVIDRCAPTRPPRCLRRRFLSPGRRAPKLAILSVLLAVGVAAAAFLYLQPPTPPYLITTKPVGNGPRGVAVDRGGTVYVTNDGDGSVSVVNTTTNTVTTIRGVGDKPTGIAVDADHNAVYVANYFSGTVRVLDGSKVLDPPVDYGDRPWGIAVGPDSRVYVTHAGTDDMAVIDGSGRTGPQKVKVGVEPRGVAVDPNTGTVYVANNGRDDVPGSVSVIDGKTHTRIGDVPVGGRPESVAVDPGANTVYVTDNAGETVWVIDARTRKFSTITVGHNPAGIAVDTSRHKVYVANEGDRSISVIDTSAGSPRRIQPDVEVGPKPLGVAVDTNTHKIFVALNGGTAVAVIESR